MEQANLGKCYFKEDTKMQLLGSGGTACVSVCAFVSVGKNHLKLFYYGHFEKINKTGLKIILQF